jgi:hypothetical protein
MSVPAYAWSKQAALELFLVEGFMTVRAAAFYRVTDLSIFMAYLCTLSQQAILWHSAQPAVWLHQSGNIDTVYTLCYGYNSGSSPKLR